MYRRMCRGDHVDHMGKFLARLALWLTAFALAAVDDLPIPIADETCCVGGQRSPQTGRARPWRRIKRSHVLNNGCNRFDAVRPVGPDQTGRTALDPAGDIETGYRLACVEAAPPGIWNCPAAFIKANPRKAHPLGADTAKEEAARQLQ